MHIKLSPMRHDTPLSLERAGDLLTFNGETVDFAQLPEGATLPQEAIGCEWVRSDVTRIDGELHLTLRLPHGPNAPHETRFPVPIIDPPDGPVALPVYSIPQEETDDVD